MAERQKSKDGRRETEEILGEKPENLEETPSHEGAKGGNIQRKVGKRDEKKRLDETSAGATRPLAQDQNESGDKEKM
ncbi:hypothetical protein OB2597_04670 [Pseudooceanicola batsensis HTCC2597]|uniref:Uncharacterized protein n=1 Tax=Pseudooceanicola batsensis (strain ATCC BAA-863 / DSM 15984 / KCTC 12145 / HTCC2597) TaxID=252305 RepID=A3TSB9_PSEBH|nr:hypothetical protein [Pseudooceanicola batsensis]EAQ04546.1 hypothetical protein OB2597_04670 [Pseudooceanicola batsensis HTCC2597]